MSEKRMETYQTDQPWVVYTYGLTHDLWWPPWNSTRWLGYCRIKCECIICGRIEVLKLRMPRFGPIPNRGMHSERVRFLGEHVHKLQQTAPETWAKPLRNAAALRGADFLDIMQDVAEKARRSPSPQDANG